MSAFLQYFKDSYSELKLVVWPKQDELIRHTILTLGSVFFGAIVLGLLDYGLSSAYIFLLSFGS